MLFTALQLLLLLWMTLSSVGRNGLVLGEGLFAVMRRVFFTILHSSACCQFYPHPLMATLRLTENTGEWGYASFFTYSRSTKGFCLFLSDFWLLWGVNTFICSSYRTQGSHHHPISPFFPYLPHPSAPPQSYTFLYNADMPWSWQAPYWRILSPINSSPSPWNIADQVNCTSDRVPINYHSSSNAFQPVATSVRYSEGWVSAQFQILSWKVPLDAKSCPKTSHSHWTWPQTNRNSFSA